MTRINCIPVNLLLDQHLLAEYREITRISSIARELDSYGSYILGTGHIKFFYNKGKYLQLRCNSLYKECIARNFKVNPKKYYPHTPTNVLNLDWNPCTTAINLNLNRLQEKFKQRPSWYKYYGQVLSNIQDCPYYLSPEKIRNLI